MTSMVDQNTDAEATAPTMELLDEGSGISGGLVVAKNRHNSIEKQPNRNVAGVPDIARHRNRLGATFIARMRADFQKHGIGTIERVRKERPAAYLELIARLMPQQMDINVQHSFVDVLLEAQRRYNQEEPYVVIDAEVLNSD